VTLTDQKEPAKKRVVERAEQDKQDIDRIVASTTSYIHHDYPGIERFLCLLYPKKVSLEAILRDHFQTHLPGPAKDITHLSRVRESTKERLDKEVAKEISTGAHVTNIGNDRASPRQLYNGYRGRPCAGGKKMLRPMRRHLRLSSSKG
jgi:hypothetical protein